ncbi:MAG: hypothetical protein ACR2PT_17510 [Endozoicomonas sp.]
MPSESNQSATNSATSAGLPQTSTAAEGKRAKNGWLGRGVAGQKAKVSAKEDTWTKKATDAARPIGDFAVRIANGIKYVGSGLFRAIKATPSFVKNDIPEAFREFTIRSKVMGKHVAIGGFSGLATGAAVSVALAGPAALVAGPFGVTPAAVPALCGLSVGVAVGAMTGYHEGKSQVRRRRQEKSSQLPVNDQYSYQSTSTTELRKQFDVAHKEGYEVIIKDGNNLLGLKDKFV